MNDQPKTADREALEARAEELGVTFAANIGDDKLAERVARAEAKAATDGGTAGAAEAKAGGDDAETAPVAAAAAKEATIAAVVLPGETLRHNGTRYAPGDPVTLTQKQFDRLRTLKVVAPAED